MSDGFLESTLPVLVGGAIVLGTAKLLLDDKKSRKRRKKRLVKKLKKVI